MVEAAIKGEVEEEVGWVEEKRWRAMCPTLWTPFNDQILLKALSLETFAMTLLGEQVGVGDIIEKIY